MTIFLKVRQALTNLMSLAYIRNARIRPCLIIFNYTIMQINIYNLQINTMDLEGLVVKKGLKGKQNKKKWVKNIDVSGLLEKIQNDQIQEERKKSAKPLTVEDTTQKVREQLDPNRFKNRVKSQPKKVYDNSYKRVDLIQDGMEDAWTGSIKERNPKYKQQLIVPAIITPTSGHSYNPAKEDVEKIIDQVIDYEKQRPRKQKKIKKLQDKKVIKRVRNKKLRQQFLQARQRKIERQALNQINSMKKIKRQLQQQQNKIAKKIKQKQKEKQQRIKQQKTGKVREGPKIGKEVYKFKQYIPNPEQLNKKLSHVGLSQQLLKQQYDSIFRRGLVEPKTVKVHANKRKNIKVVTRFEQEQK